MKSSKKRDETESKRLLYFKEIKRCFPMAYNHDSKMARIHGTGTEEKILVIGNNNLAEAISSSIRVIQQYVLDVNFNFVE